MVMVVPRVWVVRPSAVRRATMVRRARPPVVVPVVPAAAVVTERITPVRSRPPRPMAVMAATVAPVVPAVRVAPGPMRPMVAPVALVVTPELPVVVRMV